MSGPSPNDPELKGIIPRMFSTIFDTIGNAEANIEFMLEVSMLQI